jgi:HPt (histidine-containing phosphotransfer) domain-containing protein
MASNCKYDIEDFSKELGLSLSEAADLYYELVNEINSEILKLKACIAARDIENQKRIVHNIKGIAGNYRIFDVYTLSTEINNLFKGKDLDKITLLLPNYFSICQIACHEIHRYFIEKGIWPSNL